MSVPADRLYKLLPAIYRIRDAERGEPLRALLSIIGSELQRIEEDIDGLYDNWFIETCEEWVVPYIGDLLGVTPLQPVGPAGTYSHRPYIANTIAYRRRKGTAPVLEQLARDVTGWPARAVEFFQLLETTQNVNHVRASNWRTPDLRNTSQLELLDTPFDTAAHTAEVRRISSGRGKYNIANAGIFVWRLQSYAITRSTLRPAAIPADSRFLFDVLGQDLPLFNQPRTETEITHLAEEVNVPGRLRRRPLYSELNIYREALIQGETPDPSYFRDEPVFEIFTGPDAEALAPEEIVICNLSDWDDTSWQPPTSDTFTKSDGNTFVTKAAVDPVLGRVAFLQGVSLSGKPEASYSYAFSSDLGGGPYNRKDSVTSVLTREVTWHVGVGKEAQAVADESIYTTLSDAVDAWNDASSSNDGLVGVIAVLDSRTYSEDLTGDHAIRIPEGSLLMIVAANWPEVESSTDTALTERRVGHVVADGLRPSVAGNITVEGTATGSSGSPGTLALNGLLIDGHITVKPGNLGRLSLSHCTLIPGQGGLKVIVPPSPEESDNDQLDVSLYRTISGPIDLTASVPTVSLEDSIVDQTTGTVAIAATGADAGIEASTVFGAVRARTLEASNSIFTRPVIVERRQTGCARFSFAPKNSRLPRRYQCQSEPSIASFTSTQYGHPAYAQLSSDCSEEIRTGADDGSEMGAFSHLKQPQRAANLQTALKEYLRFGLEAGIFYVT